MLEDMTENMRGHWTHRLFVEAPEVYLPFLEQAGARAETEADALQDLFVRFGVPRGGKVLDVASGIGRHSVPLAARGYELTGVDLSPPYVERAREYAREAGVEARFQVGDATQLDQVLEGEGSFDAMISMFTSCGYYGRDRDVLQFRRLRGLASANALFVVSTVNRDCLVRNFATEGMERAGPYRCMQRRRLDLETSTVHSDWEYWEGEKDDLTLRLKLQMEHRVYSLHEFKALLEEAGWRFLAGLGCNREPQIELKPLTYDHLDMWVVARAT